MITLVWQDGTKTSGKTWKEAEDALRHVQWVPYKSKRAFRRDMRHRAKVWGGTKPKIGGTPRQFLEGLEAAGMCQIISREEG